ncbi:MAG: DUF5723 family protein [Bacteroidota bacterium]
MFDACFDRDWRKSILADCWNSVPDEQPAAVFTNNPAFVPKYKFALGLPGSMLDFNYYNNGFSYNDVTSQSNGKRVANLSKLTSVLPPKTYVTTVAQIDLFRLGLKSRQQSLPLVE